MPKSHSMRLGYLGSVALIALTGTWSSAQASDFSFGDVSLTIDSNVSVGASVRTSSRDMQMVSEGNGGPQELKFGDTGSVTAVNTALPSLSTLTTGNFTVTNNPYAFPGSVNGDDGRLNYTSGDVIGAPIRDTTELTAKWQNYTVFVRGTAFYDFALSDANHGDRSAITDKSIGLDGRNAKLLDAFVSAQYSIADLPVNIRVGKQVINWGESTFILNGLNNFNPIDVAAYRSPGSEIKDILLPVNAIFASVSLPFNISMSGYYALDWDHYNLDGEGTPFSNEDVVKMGSGFGGNQNAVSFLSGSPLAGYRLNCYSAADQTPGNGFTGLAFAQGANLLPGPTGTYSTQVAGVNAPNAGVTRPNCTQSGFFDYAVKYTLGQYEATSIGQANGMNNFDGVDGNSYQGIVTRGKDLFPNHTGDFGLSAKYLVDDGFLDGYEFAAYYQDYSSRLPFVGETTGSLQLGIATTGNSANVAGPFAAGFGGQTAGRYAGGAGCGLIPGAANFGGIADPRIAAMQFSAMSDPQNLLNVNSVATAYNFLGSNVQADFVAGDFIDRANGKTLAYEFTHDAAGVVTDPNPALGKHLANSIVSDFGHANFYTLSAAATTAGLGKYNSVGNAVEFNCSLTTIEAGLFSGLPMNFNGSEFLYSYNQLGLSLEYPQGIQQYGASFAGTIGTWGIQGEFTYRPNAPFQLDTDQITIAAVTQECAFVAAGNVGSLVFENLNTIHVHCDPAHPGNSRLSGVIENAMYTGQIGSTATFTNSEWFIDAIGADLGIFVPEIGFVHVPGVEKTWVDNNPLVGVTATNPGQYVGPAQYGNIGCQGSDLPLGGLLNLDHKSSKQCRPTDTSAGLVLLANASYSNAFGTGFVVVPQVAFSWDFYGTTPAPYGNYLEGRMATNFGVSAELNNSFRVGVGYTAFFGGGIANKSSDQDFGQISMAYAF